LEGLRIHKLNGALPQINGSSALAFFIGIYNLKAGGLILVASGLIPRNGNVKAGIPGRIGAIETGLPSTGLAPLTLHQLEAVAPGIQTL